VEDTFHELTTMTTPAKPAPVERKIARKWGNDLTNAGWTAIPSVIIRRQKALGLSPLDVNILLQLLSYWWDPENLPHPSKKSIAQAIGVEPRTVQRRIAAMEHAKFIKRLERRSASDATSTNNYDFSGLIAAAEPFAREELNIIAERKRANDAKLARKRPVLAVVKKEV
jgi:DNA-binding transcriptional regulator YhcF (GntR family)